MVSRRLCLRHQDVAARYASIAKTFLCDVGLLALSSHEISLVKEVLGFHPFAVLKSDEGQTKKAVELHARGIKLLRDFKAANEVIVRSTEVLF